MPRKKKNPNPEEETAQEKTVKKRRGRKKKEEKILLLPEKPFTTVLVKMRIERIAGGEPGVSVRPDGTPIDDTFQNNIFRNKPNGDKVLFEEKHVKGLMKEVCRLMGISTKIRGILFRIRHGVMMEPTEILVPAGTRIVVRSMPVLLGDKTSIVICETIEEPIEVSFKLHIVNAATNEPGSEPGPLVDLDLLKLIFEQGQAVGIGAKRTLGYGKYKLLEFKVLN